jgi:hypothetical protein
MPRVLKSGFPQFVVNAWAVAESSSGSLMDGRSTLLGILFTQSIEEHSAQKELLVCKAFMIQTVSELL